MMKKNVVLAMSAAALTAALLIGCGNSGSDENAVVPQVGSAAQTSTENYIGEEKATAIALKDAGQKESDTSALQVYLDEDQDGNDPAAYDVEFFVGDAEYDYEIDAASGDILSRDVDESGTMTQQNINNDYIGKTTAKRIALKDAGVKRSDAHGMHVALDTDDGSTVFDVEFYSGTTEYDYEIDAKSGEIVSKDQDAEGIDRADIPTSDKSLISESKARNKALHHAGLKKSDVTGLYTELDYDDGVYKYEVEFYHDRIEYSYDINAVSGQIISYESEYDD